MSQIIVRYPGFCRGLTSIYGTNSVPFGCTYPGIIVLLTDYPCLACILSGRNEHHRRACHQHSELPDAFLITLRAWQLNPTPMLRSSGLKPALPRYSPTLSSDVLRFLYNSKLLQRKTGQLFCNLRLYFIKNLLVYFYGLCITAHIMARIFK